MVEAEEDKFHTLQRNYRNLPNIALVNTLVGTCPCAPFRMLPTRSSRCTPQRPALLRRGR